MVSKSNAKNETQQILIGNLQYKNVKNYVDQMQIKFTEEKKDMMEELKDIIRKNDELQRTNAKNDSLHKNAPN